MPLHPRACCRARKRGSPVTPDHIWISDDLLDGALRRLFVPECFQRYGSSVPGPLEAQRRANRRRVMGLAPVGAPASSIEQSVFGKNTWSLGDQKWQWQAPTAAEPPRVPFIQSRRAKRCYWLATDQSSEPPPLPPWLTQGAPEHTTSNFPTEEEGSSSLGDFFKALRHQPKPEKVTCRPRNDPHTEAEGSPMRDFFQAVRRQPKSYPQPSSLRKVEAKRNAVSTVGRSTLEFRSMIGQNARMNTLIGFLEDTKLNHYKAHNLLHLVNAQLKKAVHDPEETRALCSWLGRQIALGLLPHDELEALMKVIMGRKDGSSSITSFEALYKTVFEGLSVSTLYHGENSQRLHSFNDYLMSLPKGAISRPTRMLGYELIRSLRDPDDNSLEMSLHDFLRSWVPSGNMEPSGETTSKPFRFRATEIRTSFEDTDTDKTDIAQAARQQASKLLDLLQQMPHQWLTPLLLGKDRPFFKRLLNADGGSAVLEQLHRHSEASFLVKVLPQYEAILAHWSPVAIAKYLEPKDHRAKCDFLLRNWYETELSHLSTPWISTASTLKARSERANEEHPERSPFINLLLSVRSLDYYPPATSQSRLIHLLRALDMSGTIVTLIANHRTHHVAFDARVVLDEIRHHLSTGKQRIAYKIFINYHRLAIEHVPELAELIISRPNLHSETALRLRHRRQRYLGRTKEFTQDFWAVRALRINALNRMALAYAKAPHLRPIWAARKVHDCYHTLRTEHLPVQADITRAMVHAGVVRFLQEGQWVSTVRFLRILKIVRAVEGERVADELDRMVFEWRNKVLQRGRERRDRARRVGRRVGCFVKPEFMRMVVGPRRTRRPCAKWWKSDGD